MTEGGNKPALLIVDMSNDQMKGVLYNKAPVVANIAQLAMSEFFQVCLESKAEVPSFRAKQKGAKLVDELVAFDHLKSFPKKEDSALSNPEVLQTLQTQGITHVCICGASTDSSIYATAKDLVANGMEIFLVKDATTSKNGRFGHDKGLRKIQSEFGANTVVGIDELLGEEVVVDESEVANEVVAAAPAPAPMSDAEILAARKQKVDAARFAHIKKANAEAIANADENRAAIIQKDSATAEEFTKNLPQNKATPSTESTPASSTQAAVPAPTSTSAGNTAPAKKKGFMGGLFGRKKYSKGSAPVPEPTSSAPAPAPAAPVSSTPAPAPIPASAPSPAVKATSATAMPGGGAGQKTWIKPKPEGQKTTSYTPDGAVAQPLGVKKMVQGNDVQERIAGLQSGGMSTVVKGPRKMKTPKVVTDTKETWDREGNITRTITRYITEIDGTKRTEKEIVKIPRK